MTWSHIFSPLYCTRCSAGVRRSPRTGPTTFSRRHGPGEHYCAFVTLLELSNWDNSPAFAVQKLQTFSNSLRVAVFFCASSSILMPCPCTLFLSKYYSEFVCLRWQNISKSWTMPSINPYPRETMTTYRYPPLSFRTVRSRRSFGFSRITAADSHHTAILTSFSNPSV